MRALLKLMLTCLALKLSLSLRLALAKEIVATIDGIRPEASVRSRVCRSNGDPHMNNFFGQPFEFHHEGLFCMLKTNHIKVNAKFNSCPNSNTAKCNCRVDITSSAGEMAFIDICGGTGIPIQSLSFTSGSPSISCLQAIANPHQNANWDLITSTNPNFKCATYLGEIYIKSQLPNPDDNVMVSLTSNMWNLAVYSPLNYQPISDNKCLCEGKVNSTNVNVPRENLAICERKLLDKCFREIVFDLLDEKTKEFIKQAITNCALDIQALGEQGKLAVGLFQQGLIQKVAYEALLNLYGVDKTREILAKLCDCRGGLIPNEECLVDGKCPEPFDVCTKKVEPPPPPPTPLKNCERLKCESNNDPHMVNFWNQPFEFQNSLGEHCMHKTWQVYVSASFYQCPAPWQAATCNCGVTIKVNGETASISNCGNPSFVIDTLTLSSSPNNVLCQTVTNPLFDPLQESDWALVPVLSGNAFFSCAQFLGDTYIKTRLADPAQNVVVKVTPGMGSLNVFASHYYAVNPTLNGKCLCERKLGYTIQEYHAGLQPKLENELEKCEQELLSDCFRRLVHPSLSEEMLEEIKNLIFNCALDLQIAANGKEMAEVGLFQKNLIQAEIYEAILKTFGDDAIRVISELCKCEAKKPNLDCILFGKCADEFTLCQLAGKPFRG